MDVNMEGVSSVKIVNSDSIKKKQIILSYFFSRPDFFVFTRLELDCLSAPKTP